MFTNNRLLLCNSIKLFSPKKSSASYFLSYNPVIFKTTKQFEELQIEDVLNYKDKSKPFVEFQHHPDNPVWVERIMRKQFKESVPEVDINILVPNPKNTNNHSFREKRMAKQIRALARYHEIFPDISEKPFVPTMNLVVDFEDELAFRGNLLRAEQIIPKPKVSFPEDGTKNKKYCLIMVDPDVPARENPIENSFVHWIIGNINENKIDEGQEIYNYIPPHPTKNTGYHRYCYFLFEQSKGECKFENNDLTSNFESRKSFSLDDFAEKYNLTPKGLSFVHAKWSPAVTVVLKSFGFEDEIYEPLIKRLREKHIEEKKQKQKQILEQRIKYKMI